MLSRTADHLYWMSRYTERAENTARMLNVSYDTSMLPQASQAARKAWQGVLSISELIPSYTRRHGEIQREAVLHFMVRDENNPSSIATCLRAARENARAVRGALTTEAWETQNQTWLELKRLLAEGDWERDPGQFFEWVKHRSHLSRGVTLGTMLQDEAFHFLRLGTFIERADNTARLLDVKFHAIERDYHGSARNGAAGKASAPFDFYHWSALLRSVSAFEVYRKVCWPTCAMRASTKSWPRACMPISRSSWTACTTWARASAAISWCRPERRPTEQSRPGRLCSWSGMLQACPPPSSSSTPLPSPMGTMSQLSPGPPRSTTMKRAGACRAIREWCQTPRR
jgi:uncharacterized alpha-E superfamily protein